MKLFKILLQMMHQGLIASQFARAGQWKLARQVMER